MQSSSGSMREDDASRAASPVVTMTRAIRLSTLSFSKDFLSASYRMQKPNGYVFKREVQSSSRRVSFLELSPITKGGNALESLERKRCLSGENLRSPTAFTGSSKADARRFSALVVLEDASEDGTQASGNYVPTRRGSLDKLMSNSWRVQRYSLKEVQIPPAAESRLGASRVGSTASLFSVSSDASTDSSGVESIESAGAESRGSRHGEHYSTQAQMTAQGAERESLAAVSSEETEEEGIYSPPPNTPTTITSLLSSIPSPEPRASRNARLGATAGGQGLNWDGSAAAMSTLTYGNGQRPRIPPPLPMFSFASKLPSAAPTPPQQLATTLLANYFHQQRCLYRQIYDQQLATMSLRAGRLGANPTTAGCSTQTLRLGNYGNIRAIERNPLYYQSFTPPTSSTIHLPSYPNNYPLSADKLHQHLPQAMPLATFNNNFINSQIPCRPPSIHSQQIFPAVMPNSHVHALGTSRRQSKDMTACIQSHGDKGEMSTTQRSSPRTTGRRETSRRRHQPARNSRAVDAPQGAINVVEQRNGHAVTSKFAVISAQMRDFHKRVEQNEPAFSRKAKLRDQLYEAISLTYPLCGLYVIGSSLNGFGTSTSDLDLCLMVTNRDVNQELDAVMVLDSLMGTLAHHTAVASQHLISSAKVPILRLRFNEPFADITVDLNVNNSVAIRNSHLLFYYSILDDRVKPLVVMVKEWAKRKGINDATNGSFTSYSLVLMVIHYLQCGVNPPVLPSLQQACPQHFGGSVALRNLNININLNDIKPSCPTHYHRNVMELGELLLGFLDYYAHTFNFTTDAISVRLGQRLDRASVARHVTPYNSISQWHWVCIEEPFTCSNTAHAVYAESVFETIKAAFVSGHAELTSANDLTEWMAKL